MKSLKLLSTNTVLFCVLAIPATCIGQSKTYYKFNEQRTNKVNQTQVAPDELRLKGNVRNFNFSSSVGNINLRWQENPKPLFGKNPYLLVKDAWFEATKTLNNHYFPSFVKNSRVDWKVVFMDQESTRNAYPIKNRDCHPAWIRPPANMYISSYYIATDCGQKKLSVSESRPKLRSILYHEFGHAIEFQLTGSTQRQKYHSEGFAKLFESIAQKDHGLGYQVQKDLKFAKKYFRASWNPKYFSGSYYEYQHVFAMFHTFVKKFRINRLFKVYSKMRNQGLLFETALQKEVGWDLKKWSKMTKKYLDSI